MYNLFKNVLAFIDLFYRYHHIRYQIARDAMFVQQ